MKTAGIIAEYNPFHNGHHYHIEETRRLTGADFVVVVMSGDFTQRGTPALTDKYARARMALLGGADLVLELPVLFSAGSAGDFAAGAVSLLDKLHAADFLSFGSEAGTLDGICRSARILADEPPTFSEVLKKELKGGSSFAKARAVALSAVLNAADSAASDGSPYCATDVSDPRSRSDASVPEGPNNLLGLEYCTALYKRNSSMQPMTIQRRGAGYHELELGDAMPSALSIRKYLENEHAAVVCDDVFQILTANIPESVLPVWKDILSEGRLLFPADLTKELRYRLLSCDDDLSAHADVTRELADKLKNNLFDFSDWDDLCTRAKSKELTYSRISRALCHILLGVTADSLQAARENDFAPYARILGFKKSAQPLLSEIKKNSEIPLLSKLADAHRLLSPEAMAILKQDIAAAHIYESAMACKCNTAVRNEFRQQIVVIE